LARQLRKEDAVSHSLTRLSSSSFFSQRLLQLLRQLVMLPLSKVDKRLNECVTYLRANETVYACVLPVWA